MDNLTINQIIKDDLFEKYYNIFKHVVPSTIMSRREARSMTKDMSYGEVQYIKKLIPKQTYDAFLTSMEIMFNIQREDILKVKASMFFPALNHLIEEVKNIVTMEKQLYSDPDQKLIEAGIEELDKFGTMNGLIMIGQKYSIMPHELEKMPFQRIFTHLLHNKISNEINKRLAHAD